MRPMTFNRGDLCYEVLDRDGKAVVWITIEAVLEAEKRGYQIQIYVNGYLYGPPKERRPM